MTQLQTATSQTAQVLNSLPDRSQRVAGTGRPAAERLAPDHLQPHQGRPAGHRSSRRLSASACRVPAGLRRSIVGSFPGASSPMFTTSRKPCARASALGLLALVALGFGSSEVAAQGRRPSLSEDLKQKIAAGDARPTSVILTASQAAGERAGGAAQPADHQGLATGAALEVPAGALPGLANDAADRPAVRELRGAVLDGWSTTKRSARRCCSPASLEPRRRRLTGARRGRRGDRFRRGQRARAEGPRRGTRRLHGHERPSTSTAMARMSPASSPRRA